MANVPEKPASVIGIRAVAPTFARARPLAHEPVPVPVNEGVPREGPGAGVGPETLTLTLHV